jgi:hypothetical protein
MERKKQQAAETSPKPTTGLGPFFVITAPARQKIEGMFRYFEIIPYFCIRK